MKHILMESVCSDQPGPCSNIFRRVRGLDHWHPPLTDSSESGRGSLRPLETSAELSQSQELEISELRVWESERLRAPGIRFHFIYLMLLYLLYSPHFILFYSIPFTFTLILISTFTFIITHLLSFYLYSNFTFSFSLISLLFIFSFPFSFLFVFFIFTLIQKYWYKHW